MYNLNISKSVFGCCKLFSPYFVPQVELIGKSTATHSTKNFQRLRCSYHCSIGCNLLESTLETKGSVLLLVNMTLTWTKSFCPAKKLTILNITRSAHVKLKHLKNLYSAAANSFRVISFHRFTLLARAQRSTRHSLRQ